VWHNAGTRGCLVKFGKEQGLLGALESVMLPHEHKKGPRKKTSDCHRKGFPRGSLGSELTLVLRGESSLTGVKSIRNG